LHPLDAFFVPASIKPALKCQLHQGPLFGVALHRISRFGALGDYRRIHADPRSRRLPCLVDGLCTN
jgi:hypothetical protein